MRQRGKRALVGGILGAAVLVLSGCDSSGQARRADELTGQVRTRYLALTGCTGRAELTADYGERVYTFGVEFSWQKEGETVLTLTAPENVAGTTARIAAGETALEYDGVSVETGPLDETGLTPMSTVPALLETARTGYLAEVVLEQEEGEEELLHVISRSPDTQPGSGVETELWFTTDTYALRRGESSQDGRTVVFCQVEEMELAGDGA